MQLTLRSVTKNRARGTATLVALVSGIIAVVALRTVHSAPELGYVASSPSGAAALLVPGLAAIGVALASLYRQAKDRSALLLALAGAASLLPELSVAGTQPALAFTAGLVLAWAAPPLVGHLALAYPARVTGGPNRAICAAGYLSAIVALGLMPALVFDRVEAGCSQCAANLVLLQGSIILEAPLARIGIASALAWATLCMTMIALRLARATPAARRLLWPVLLPSTVLVGCFGAELALSLRRAFLATGNIDRWLWLGGQLALLALAVGMASRRLRARRAREMLARDVIELSNRTGADSVAARLSVVLGDPTLEIAYPVGEPVRFVDVNGTPVDVTPRDSRALTTLRGLNGKPDTVALLCHRPGLLDDPVLVEEITRTARLPLANERLQADAEARLALLQASRKRIVAAADTERQHIERNLHDGAQQRLVSLAVALRATRSEENGDVPSLDGAQQEVQRALEELRLIARGLYPAVLDELGFAAAIEALAETAPVPVKISGLPPGRFDPVVEATGYFVCAETVRDPTASRVTIKGGRDGERLTLAVTTDAPTRDLIRLSDRVGAAGGTIRPEPLTDGVVLEAEIPCES